MIQPGTRTVATLMAGAFMAFIAAPAAHAVTINVNIVNGAPQQPGLVGPAGGLGETWNELSTTSATGLVDAFGVPTTVGYTSTGTSWGGPDTWGNPTLEVLRDGLRNFDTSPGNSQQLVINGLTAGEVLDVWLLSANLSNPPSNQRSNGQWSTTNASDTLGPQLVDNTLLQNGSTFVEGNNFVFFDNIVANAAGELVFNGNSFNQSPTFDNRLPLNGFQIAANAAAIPEPATAALALMGLAGLMIRPRRLA